MALNLGKNELLKKWEITYILIVNNTIDREIDIEIYVIK